MKSLTKNNEGFISIIAIGVFALLMIFAISLQINVIDTLQNLKNGQNYDSARDVADSTIEYLQKKMQGLAPGLNDTANCIFVGGALKTNDAALVNPSVCTDLAGIIGTKNATVSITVKGRSENKDNKDKLNSSTTKCGAGDCFVTPTPGTGDAGVNCAMYKPNVTVQSTTNVDMSLTNSMSMDQVDYSCNWNKLTFGSSQTDRVAIPLYFDKGTLGDGSEIVNPYFGATPLAKKFYVRLRTPCKPCAEGANPTADQRSCDENAKKDPTVCLPEERYKLDAGGGVNGSTDDDDIVVQWLINGLCGTDACGLMPIADKAKFPNTFSSLYESKIYANNLVGKENKSTTLYYALFDTTDAYDTNNYPNTATILSKNDGDKLAKENKLKEMTKPVLTLFLNRPLLTEPPLKSNIPYLEYQVLTDYPIGNSKSSLEVIVNVEGNNFKKTLTQEVQKALIDFAIHN